MAKSSTNNRKVPHNKLAAPIVPVSNGDGKMRLCGDYKVTVNQSLDVDQCPLPKPGSVCIFSRGSARIVNLYEGILFLFR